MDKGADFGSSDVKVISSALKVAMLNRRTNFFGRRRGNMAFL
jgi:hypothetical protein